MTRKESIEVAPLPSDSKRTASRAALLVLGCALVCASPGPARSAIVNDPAPDAGVENESVDQQWGIELRSVRATAAGRMIDLRYKVTDAGKAIPLFKRQTKPFLLDKDTGLKFAIASTAKTGPLRNSDSPETGRVYVMLFNTPGGVLAPGDKVTLVIGDFRLEDLVVE
ncbi:MAG: hypothetical protein ACE5D3_00965 [Candidatus Binatia bacterium]